MTAVYERVEVSARPRNLKADPAVKILSVSLGSPKRDHSASVTLLGHRFEIERRGTNGDFARALDIFRELDGEVGAFGVGGIEFYMPVANRRYYWRDARRIRAAIRKSKVGDGNGVREILAVRAVQSLERHLNASGRTLRGMTALKTTISARYFLGKALVDAGCKVTFGDFMFGLQLPIPVRGLGLVRTLAPVLLPIVTQIPYHWLYALGDAQMAPPVQRWNRYYRDAQVIAGDYLQIRAHMPDDLRGKIIITNTTTARDVDDLKARGVHLLVTETPRLGSRTFGSNVLEALLLAMIDRPQEQITAADFEQLIARVPLEPSIEELNPFIPAATD